MVNNTIQSRYQLRELLNKFESHFSICKETRSFQEEINNVIMSKYSHNIQEKSLDEILTILPYGIENRYYNLNLTEKNTAQYLDLSLSDALSINALIKDKILDTRAPTKWNVSVDNASGLLAYGTDLLCMKNGPLEEFSKLFSMDKIIMQLKNQFLYNLSLRSEINEYKAHIQLGEEFLNYFGATLINSSAWSIMK